MGVQAGVIGAWFRGLVPGYEVAPALWGAAATSAGGSLFLLILWSSIAEPVSPRTAGFETARTIRRTFVVEGALLGALLGALGGSLSATFVQLAKGDSGAAEASIPGRALLASRVGAITGALVVGLRRAAKSGEPLKDEGFVRCDSEPDWGPFREVLCTYFATRMGLHRHRPSMESRKDSQRRKTTC